MLRIKNIHFKKKLPTHKIVELLTSVTKFYKNASHHILTFNHLIPAFLTETQKWS